METLKVNDRVEANGEGAIITAISDDGKLYIVAYDEGGYSDWLKRKELWLLAKRN